MANCAVEHEVIVITCHSSVTSFLPSIISLGLGQWWRAEELVALASPTEYVKYVKYVKYDKYDKFYGKLLVENAFCHG